ncbi:hypothetical protein [Arthrobacter sp. NPDC056727]|uniref:hypothetical protein n=1 Tax=Arthrobacter sp. NPDC056727 TaxID=3345927 RepID=UPI00367014AE
MRLHPPAAREGTPSLPVPPTSPRGGYQYRGKSARTAAPEEGTKDNIEKALQSNRQVLSQALAAIRATTVRRNEQIAEAIWDGVPPRTIAAAASMTITEVRSIGVAFEEMLPPGAPSDVHVA